MRRERSSTHPAARQPRPRRRISSASPAERGKPPEITACPGCGATYRAGRWTWQPAPADAREATCLACGRIAQRDPAGEVRVEGTFAARHRDDLLGLVRNVEERERSRDPLKRIMKIAPRSNGFVAQTTDGKLAHAIGRALRKAYAGELEHAPTTAEKENLVRVRWVRD